MKKTVGWLAGAAILLAISASGGHGGDPNAWSLGGDVPVAYLGHFAVLKDSGSVKLHGWQNGVGPREVRYRIVKRHPFGLPTVYGSTVVEQDTSTQGFSVEITGVPKGSGYEVEIYSPACLCHGTLEATPSP